MVGLQYIKPETRLRRGGTQKKYTPEFKARVGIEALELGNASAIARKYDIATQTIDNWVNKARVS